MFLCNQHLERRERGRSRSQVFWGSAKPRDSTELLDILFCSPWCHTAHLVCSCRGEETINLPVPRQTRLNQCREKSRGNPSMVFGGKESACQCRRYRFNPWFRKSPLKRKWQSTPVFLPGKSHGQRNLVGYSPWGHKRVGHDLTD